MDSTDALAAKLAGTNDLASRMPFNNNKALEFLKDQCRHCKPILALGSAADQLKRANIPVTLPGGEPDPGLIVGKADQSKPAVELFVTALAGHRSFARESDPPMV